MILVKHIAMIPINYIIYPLILLLVDYFCNYCNFFISPYDDQSIHKALNSGTYISGAWYNSVFALSYILFKLAIFFATISGLIAGVAIGLITEYYTSYDYSPVKRIAEASVDRSHDYNSGRICCGT